MPEYDTTALVEDVRQRGSLPANDLRFTAAQIRAAATLELREGVAPLLSTSRAEHLVYPYTVAVVSGTSTYRMPPRAIGGSLRNVSFVDSANTAIRLRELSMDEVETIGTSTNQGTPFAYYTQNYSVVLVPVPNVAGTLSMPYYARPNALVLQGSSAVSGARCVALTSVSGDTTFITIVTSPPTVLTAATRVDIVRATPGFETLVAGAPVTVEFLGGSYRFTITGLASGVGLSIATGDYLCLPNEAPVPQVPVELHGLLAARTARRLLKAVGDDRWQSVDADVQELEGMALKWLAPRVAGQTQQSGSSIGSSGIGPFGGAWWWAT